MEVSKLFIGNLPLGIEKQDVVALLERYGIVLDVRVVESETVSFAFVTIEYNADTTIKALNRTMYHG